VIVQSSNFIAVTKPLLHALSLYNIASCKMILLSVQDVHHSKIKQVASLQSIEGANKTKAEDFVLISTVASFCLIMLVESNNWDGY